MEHLLCLLEFTIEGSSACTLSVRGFLQAALMTLPAANSRQGKKERSPRMGTPSFCCPGKAGNNRVVIRFQENTYGWLLPAVTLEAGKRYGYALSLGKEGGLILSGVSVRPWQEGEDYNGTIKPNK